MLKLTFNHVSYTPCLHGECSSGTISTILQMNRGTEINWLAFGLTAKASRSSQPELADSRVAVAVTMIQCVLEWSYEHSTYFSFLYKLPDVTSLSWNQSWMRHTVWAQGGEYRLRVSSDAIHSPSVSDELAAQAVLWKTAYTPLPISLPGEAGVRRGRSLDSRLALPLLPRRSTETLSPKKVSSPFPGAWHTASE